MLTRAERAGSEERIEELLEEMRIPPLPRFMWPIWLKFLRLSRRREWSDWGTPKLIKHTEILAFQQLTGMTFTPWEIDQIEILDGAYIAVMSEAKRSGE